jgi:hypothetical protein
LVPYKKVGLVSVRIGHSGHGTAPTTMMLRSNKSAKKSGSFSLLYLLLSANRLLLDVCALGFRTFIEMGRTMWCKSRPTNPILAAGMSQLSNQTPRRRTENEKTTTETKGTDKTDRQTDRQRYIRTVQLHALQSCISSIFLFRIIVRLPAPSL